MLRIVTVSYTHLYANPGERFKFTIDRVGAEKLQEVLKGAYNG